jgi:RNA polymerase sigma factor (sigma-70 family)
VDEQRDAFERYVLPETEVLLRVALSLTRRPADAEDLVQDTLIRAYRSIDRFDGAHPRAWLLTIMRNAHINNHRRRRPELLRDPEVTLATLAAVPSDGQLDPEGVVVGETFGMRGGRLSIGGKAGSMLGERMRRGLVVVQGGAGDYAGARMIAGTLLIKGRVGRWAGFGLRRGSIILSKEPKDLLPTFGDCGVLDFNWLRVLERNLQATGARVKFRCRARRLMGDMAVLGKGEMLILA